VPSSNAGAAPIEVDDEEVEVAEGLYHEAQRGPSDALGQMRYAPDGAIADPTAQGCRREAGISAAVPQRDGMISCSSRSPLATP
jgi:hypothetical protein